MTKHPLLRILTIAFIPLLLTGCFATSPNYGVTGKPRPITLDQQLTFYGVNFDKGSQAISDMEKSNISAFLEQYRGDEGDDLAVSFSPDQGNMAIARSKAVMDYIKKLGLNVSPTAAPSHLDDEEVALVRIKYVIRLPNCPDWSYGAGYDPSNNTTSNFNCATQTNLGMMIANPKDLLGDRPMSAADGAGSILSIQRYRAGKITPLQEDSPTNPTKQ